MSAINIDAPPETWSPGWIPSGPFRGNKLPSLRGDGRVVYGAYRPVGGPGTGSCPPTCGKLNQEQADRQGKCDSRGAAFRLGVLRGALLNPGLWIYSYTHAWSAPEIIEWRDSLPGNVQIAASVDNEEDIERAIALGWRIVAFAVPSKTGYIGKAERQEIVRIGNPQKGRAVVACAAQKKSPTLGCADCLLCVKPPRDELVLLIGFAGHGNARGREDVDRCYAQEANVNIHQNNARHKGVEWDEAIRRLPRRAILRLCISGDSL